MKLCYSLERDSVILYGSSSQDNPLLPLEPKWRWNDNKDTHESAKKKLLPAALYTM